MKVDLNYKLLQLFSKLQDNRYYSQGINYDRLSIYNVYDTYLKLPVMGKSRVFDNIYAYLSLEFYDDCREYDLKKVFFDVESISRNHDKVIQGIKQEWIIEFTTGSTGKPFPTVKTKADKVIESAYLLRQRKKYDHSITLENGFKFLHSYQPELLDIDIWKFNDSDMEKIVNGWIENKPKWMLATPKIYSKYASYINDRSIEVFNDNDLAFIEYTSQGILKEEEELIQKTYKCKMVNSFGARECWNIAYECKYGNLHLNNNYLHVDLVDMDNNIINDEKEGNIIVTHFSNTTMPLIKYKFGDIAKKKKVICKCGNESDVIEICKERDSSKLINTPYYGTSIFRRVMRGIYFHDYIADIKNICVVQDGGYHLSVYVDKAIENDIYFERRFYERTKSIVDEIDKFTITFIYGSFFMPETANCKETIFKNMLHITP